MLLSLPLEGAEQLADEVAKIPVWLRGGQLVCRSTKAALPDGTHSSWPERGSSDASLTAIKRS